MQLTNENNSEEGPCDATAGIPKGICDQLQVDLRGDQV